MTSFEIGARVVYAVDDEYEMLGTPGNVVAASEVSADYGTPRPGEIAVVFDAGESVNGVFVADESCVNPDPSWVPAANLRAV
jgi:hypothetical protein